MFRPCARSGTTWPSSSTTTSGRRRGASTGVPSRSLKDKWTAAGWSAHDIDGHDLPKLVDLLSAVPDGHLASRPQSSPTR